MRACSTLQHRELTNLIGALIDTTYCVLFESFQLSQSAASHMSLNLLAESLRSHGWSPMSDACRLSAGSQPPDLAISLRVYQG